MAIVSRPQLRGNGADSIHVVQEEVSPARARRDETNQELERARQAVLRERDLRTRLMNSVSHELRTPLNAVVNFAHILAQGGQGEVNEAQADYLRRIEESGRQILQVLNDLLDMAQIESGEFRLYPEPVNLRQICEETVRYAQAVVLDKDVAFIEDYPETWPCVNVDKVRLKQSLINLLRNAARHTERGHIALRVRPENGVVRLHVEDSGSGIDAHYQQMIFQEFRQVDEQAARRRIGTGLGLSLTRHVVERHGGTVTVDSAVGEGSTFTITLPVWQGAPAAVK